MDKNLETRLKQLGILDESGTRDYNVGASDYSQHIIQPWAIWIEYGLNPWDADIVKRVLRDDLLVVQEIGLREDHPYM